MSNRTNNPRQGAAPPFQIRPLPLDTEVRSAALTGRFDAPVASDIVGAETAWLVQTPRQREILPADLDR